LEKKQYGWRDRYGEEKKRYLVRVGWVTRAEEGIECNREETEKEVIERERSKMRREEKERIKNARYKLKYKEIKIVEGCPRYLREGNLEGIDKGEEVRA